jgi:glycosyltransferase involved in cell wall biosynthesis
VTPGSLTYAAVTPVWNEAETLERLADCLRSQTRPPSAWVIVDTGSSDRTREVAAALSDEHAWISTVTSGGEGRPQPGAPIVRAFHVGLEHLELRPHVVVKLDADVSFADDYFEGLLAAFAAGPTLGIASGSCWERDATETWRETQVSSGHVRGATRAYRWSCLQQLLPLEESMGWDGIDELKANTLGWRTEIVDGLAFFHHRRVGARDGSASARWKAQGRGAHYMGYRFWYLLLRSLHRARTDASALWMIGGYLAAAGRREPRYADAAVRRELHRRQSLRQLASQTREALQQRRL